MSATSLTEFRESLDDVAPASGLPPAFAALWWAHRGDWDTAHRVVQSEQSRDAAWVHAYLHRQEGDEANAGYLYRNAGRPVDDGPLEAEWDKIAAALSADGES